MTEAEWAVCTAPHRMLRFLRDSENISRRQERLFAVAVCRRLWPLLNDQRSRQAIELAERAADAYVPERELDQVSAAAEEAWEELVELAETGRHADLRAAEAAAHAASYASSPSLTLAVLEEVLEATEEAAFFNSREGEDAAQAAVLRDIVGNPFRRSPLVDPSWLGWNGDIIPALARTISDVHAFDRLSILADALEDAGCTDRVILDHCRGPGPHVRGCWVVDLILGKP